MATLPTGTVTFLFTDIEGSTRLLQQLGDRYASVLADHHRLLRAVFQKFGGHEVDTQGDAFFITFVRARDAVAAAIEAQRVFAKHPWPEGATVRVRMGLHTGEPLSADTGYVGMDLHRAARISHVGHGGQILLSDTTRALVEEDLPVRVTLKDLGNHRLKDLSHPQHLFQVVVPELATDFPPLKSLDVLPNNLPLQLTSFVGRGHEMTEAKRLLTSTRLLTLTGAGGSGKTRLALQVAANLLDHYHDGVRLVELAPLSDSALIPQTVASTLGVHEEPGRPLTDTLADFLRPKSLLLLLDNCEHLLSPCAQLADALLRACPTLRILATSREALGITGETAYRLPSLSLPDVASVPVKRLAQYEAVRLFIDRAAAALPTFKVTTQNATAVATICQRLDGIPLAVELAAVRVKALSVEHIAERLHDRFKLLTGGSRTAMPRHQTLRAALDWSFALLSEPERAVLRRLSVFAGGFALEAAEAVCPGQDLDATDVLDLLTHLVEKSLVVFQEREGRYRLLETVRQYGRDKLLEAEEAPEARTRHRDFFMALAEDAEPHLRGAEAVTWLDRLETEYDNLRAALDWSLESGQTEAALRIAGALWWYWVRRGHWSEGRGWLERALAEAKGASSSARAKALVGAADHAYYLHNFDRATGLAEESLTLSQALGDKYGVALSLVILGFVARDRGDYERSVALFEQSLALAQEVGHKWGTAVALMGLGTVIQREDYERAATLLKESLGLFRGIGDKHGIGRCLMLVGSVAQVQGDYQRAIELYTESLTIVREMGDNYRIANSLLYLGIAAKLQGDYGRAQTLIDESLVILRRFGEKIGFEIALEELGLVALHQGDTGRATGLFQESSALRREMGTKLGIAASLRTSGLLAQVQGDYEQAKALLNESLSLYRETHSKLDIATLLSLLGRVAQHKSDYQQADGLYKESLKLQKDIGHKLGIAECLEGLAVVAGVKGQPDRAAALFATAEAIRKTVGAPLPPVDRAEYDRNVDAVRVTLGEEMFSAASAKGRAMPLEQAIEYALKEI